MATTSYAFTDPRAQKVWAPDMFEYALQNVRLSMLMGKSQDSIIHLNTDLTRGPGGDVVFKIKNPLSGAGKGDDGNTTGAEEAMTTGNFSVRVHQRSHSVRSAGAMSQQLTDIYKTDGFRRDGRDRLGSWVAESIENDLSACSAGLYNENSSGAAIETINESYPETDRILYLGQSITTTPALGNAGVNYGTDALLTAGTRTNNFFGTLVIDKVRALALEATPRFKPGIFTQPSASAEKDVRFAAQGKMLGKYFAVLVHPQQKATMRAEVGTNGWANMSALALARGSDHPIFSGGNIYWNGCIVVEYDRIHKRTGAGGYTLAEGFLLNAGRTAVEAANAVATGRIVCRAIFMGAQAMCFGWAMYPSWSEDYVDNDIPKIKTNMIYGLANTKFNSHGTTSAQSEHAIYMIDTEI